MPDAKMKVNLLLITSICFNLANTFSDDDFDRLSSSSEAQSNDAMMMHTDSESNLIDENEIMMLPSNLSCYVCSTIDDMRCKFINETNKHLYAESFIDDGDEGDSYTASASTTTSMDFLIDSGASPVEEYRHNNHHRNQHYYHQHSPHSDADTFQRQSSSSSGESSPLDSNYGDVAATSPQQRRIFGYKCGVEEQFCMVRRLGVSPLSGQNAQTSEYNFFAVQRSCAKHCNSGCFIIGNGERTKLSFCTTCCTTDYCNVGSGAVGVIAQPIAHVTILISVVISISCYCSNIFRSSFRFHHQLSQ